MMEKPFFSQFVAIVFAGVVFSLGWMGVSAYQQSSLVNQFNLTNERIAKDLEGRQLQAFNGQIWPFESGQGLTVSMVAKKQIENFVIVAVDVRAIANVEQPKDLSKEQKEKQGKLPTRVSISGYLKLTYERIGSDWYLIAIDNLTSKAAAHFD